MFYIDIEKKKIAKYLVFSVLTIFALTKACERPKEKIVVKTRVDTEFVPQPVHDTVYHDSVRIVKIPIKEGTITGDTFTMPCVEVKHYCNDNYEAYVSGIDPSLDSIRVFNKTTIREVTREKVVYKPYIPAEKPLRFGGFVGSSTAFDLQHINANAGLRVDYKKFSVKAGYNIGEYSYPFIRFEYNIR